MRLLISLGPDKLGTFEGRKSLGVGHVFGMRAEGGEFPPAPLGHGAPELRIFMIGEIEKRRACTPLLALKQHRNKWRRHDQGRGDFEASKAHQMTAALALGAIADLIVVLQIAEKRMPRQSRGGSAVPAPSKLRIAAVVDKHSLRRFSQIGDRTEVG